MFDQPRREPMLNVPAVVVALLVVLGVIQAVLMLVLTAEQTTEFLLLFAFIPARYDASVLPDVAWPGGWAADIWTFVTYALIHADFSHLIFNAVWFLAFGSPVAQRFGWLRFLAFMAVAGAGRTACHKPSRSAGARIPAGLVRRQYPVWGLLPGHARRRAGDRLAGAYRRIPGRAFCLRRIRSGSAFDRIRQRQGARSDTDDPLTIAWRTRARPATVGRHLAGLGIPSDNLGLVSAAQRSMSSAAEPIASRTGPAARLRSDDSADGTRWQIEHCRAGTPRARSKPREATHARQEHSLRQG